MKERTIPQKKFGLIFIVIGAVLLAAGGTIFFPASGHRNNIRGKIGNFGMFGFYWSATPQSQKAAGAFYCNRVNVSPILRYGRANGFAVRPVQE